jgi:DNA-directed RNA polymerase subunit RPC12/RpoP
MIEVANSNPSPKEARERICPQCRSADILALGRVLADSTAVRGVYRCRACAKEFLMLPMERRLGPRDRRAPS